MELADNVYYRNVSNNAGIFDYLIATAEDQECKQALLVYHFIRKMAALPTITEIASRIEEWLAESFEVKVGFDVAAALKTLDRFDLVRYQAERLSVLPLKQAIPKLHEAWNNFFKKT
jgi:predicted transcriptional regulator YdeE